VRRTRSTFCRVTSAARALRVDYGTLKSVPPCWTITMAAHDMFQLSLLRDTSQKALLDYSGADPGPQSLGATRAKSLKPLLPARRPPLLPPYGT
jgi:hypothetical protein